MKTVIVRYEDGLQASLADPDEAAAYLDAAFAENDRVLFLLALREIVEVRGFSQIAQATLLNRENLYRMLSPTGNPQLSSWMSLL